MDLSSSVDLVTGKAISILENEVSLLTEVRAAIDNVKLDLKTMKSFLEDAEEKKGVAANNKTENEWVASVRDIAYEIEDVVDEFMYHFNKQKQWRGKCSSFLLKLIHFPKNLLVRHRVAVKLQDIDKRIKRITERSQRFQVSRLESGKCNEKREGKTVAANYDTNWVKNLSESSLFLKDDELVGIEKAQRKLLGWLMDKELQRTVIAVVGMGGLGKTTLAANTFKKPIVEQHFECCAWITVSQQYTIEELFNSLIKEVKKKENRENGPRIENLSAMTYIDLVEELRKSLETKRYLIVLDDVWCTAVWERFSNALPTSMNGSRILLTTRQEDVASFEFGVLRHRLPLKPLTDAKGWTLFCKKAFPSGLGRCPPYLESLARKLVAKCEGLPLAIVALGGLMASKKSTREWSGIYENLNWELSENDKLKRLKYISLLSYHDLPYRLKHCFLYCCIFPEDYEIKRKRLIRLWMAEGFVEQQEEDPEVVADGYLEELVYRGLLQVVTRNGSGRPKTCKMHDILRELALSISKEEKFVAKSDGKEEVEGDGIRRLSIEAREKEMKASGKAGLSRLRSLFVFAIDVVSQSSFNRLPFGFKLLRVLDLEDAPVNELPGELVKLFNLRYLNLTSTQVKELPKSIGELYNLQSLLLKRTQIKELPPGIVKLKNLRHLIVYRYNVTGFEFHYALGASVPSNICRLKSLQVLSFVEARVSFIKQLSSMTQLRRFSIANVKEADEKILCFAISKMRRLHYLLVKSCNEDEQLKMDALESAPRCLDKLVLAGKLEKVPHWFHSLHSLTSLYLHWSGLRDDFLPHIQALPNLAEILLLKAYEGERLNFLEGFQKLKRLHIVECPRLKEIAMNEGVMPCLQELEIVRCQEMMTLPHGWESLPDLKQVFLQDVSRGLIDKICGSSEIQYQPTIRAVDLIRREDHGWRHKIYRY
ncbi:disease resistance protein RPM1-like [Durio zibethinus]|uniref:Disease resistance protein RPM1-like n=1 Tax=Durio zibethinus TaxID=66656 RepID=A0A6P5WS00_DURZI|nr:disease resistance protein RPM1-like [Durio zibethinus]